MPHRKRSWTVPRPCECLAPSATGGLRRPEDAGVHAAHPGRPPHHSVFGQMTQCGTPAIAARCIGHRSALRGHMQRTAFSAHPLCPILHISLPREIHSPTLSPSERFEARQDEPKRPQKHICCTRTGAMPPPSGNIAPVPIILSLMPTIQPGGSMHKGHLCLRASICSWNLRTSLGWRSATLVCSPWSSVMRNSWGVGL